MKQNCIPFATGMYARGKVELTFEESLIQIRTKLISLQFFSNKIHDIGFTLSFPVNVNAHCEYD